MRMRLCLGSFQLVALIILSGAVVFLGPSLLWAYGGGGGAGAGGGDGSGAQSSAIQPLTRQQIENILGRIGKGQGLSPQVVETFVRHYQGQKIKPRELYKIRQRLLEVYRWQANNWSSFMGGCTALVETVDTVGSYTQIALSFVPGVGWVTVTALSAARSGAETYQTGGDAGQIVKSMAIDGTVSVIMKGSPIGNKGSKALQRAGRAYQGSKQAVSQTVKNALIKSGDSNLVKGLALQTINKYTGDGVKAGLTAGVNAVQNNVPSPSYSSSSSGGGWGPHYAK